MEQIPAGKFKYDRKPVFVRWPADDKGKWHVWGPEHFVQVGEVSHVYKYSDDQLQPVEIIEHVAERLVSKADGSKIRFVLATFDRVFEDDDAD